MVEYTKKIQEIAKRLLMEKKVDAVIGYRRGTVPMMNEPLLVRDLEGIDQLYWDSFCGINLANYLPKRKERLAIVAKGCDSRNIIIHLQEGQIKREQLHDYRGSLPRDDGPAKGLGQTGGKRTSSGRRNRGSVGGFRKRL